MSLGYERKGIDGRRADKAGSFLVSSLFWHENSFLYFVVCSKAVDYLHGIVTAVIGTHLRDFMLLTKSVG